jgi:hypothetical protein
MFFLFLVSLGGVRLNPLDTSATVVLLYQPRMIDDDDYGAVGGMRIARGNRSAPVPLFPPQIPRDLTWDRTRAAAVGSQRLTAWAMARPEDVWARTGTPTAPSNINPGTRRRWMVTFNLRTLHPQRKSPRCPLDGLDPQPVRTRRQKVLNSGCPARK